MTRINLADEIYRTQQEKDREKVTYGTAQQEDKTVVLDKDVRRIVEDIKVYLADYHGNVFSQSVLDADVKERVQEIIQSYIIENQISVPSMSLDDMIEYCQKEICGFGPIEPPLKDSEVSEIMVNTFQEVYVEKSGRLELSDIQFQSDEQLVNIIRKILAPIGRNIDLAEPYVDAKLPGGSRVNAVIYPISLQGTNLTIRKFVKIDFTAQELLQLGTCSAEMLEFLEMIVRYKGNFFVIGGTGSGKTSTLKFLTNYIPLEERLVTIEDVEELRLKAANPKRHVISQEARKSRQNPVTIYDLLKNALRQRPDRIIVGEVRGEEALEMTEAMNTGHEGSGSTFHANDSDDAIIRLAIMLQRGGLDYQIAREVISNTVDYIINQRRMIDGSRKIVEISQVDGYDLRRKQPIIKPVFEYIVTGIVEGQIQGDFKQTGGLTPRKVEKLILAGAPKEKINRFCT